MTVLPESKSIAHQDSEISHYGWIVVGMAFLANLVVYGLVYSFSVFLKPLASEFGWSRSVTAGAFGFYGFLHTLLAVLAGRVCDRFGPRWVLSIASFFLGLSMILMAHITTIWDLYLYYGVFFSIGVAAEYTPVMSTVSQCFKAKRGFAIGLTAAGLGAGSIVFSPLSAWLISSFGWRKAYIIVGILSWVVFIPIVKFIKQVPDESRERGEFQGFSFSEAFRTRPFWALGFSWFFICIAMWAILIHIVPFATDRGMSMMTAGILAGIIGAASIIGRISAGFLSDKVGRKRVLITEFYVQLITFIWLLFSTRIWMLFLFVALFGLSSGGWAGVIAAFPADYFGFKATGSIFGFANTLAGVGVAIGPYVGGYIFDSTRSYTYMILMCIMATIAAIISASLLRPPLKLSSSRRGQLI
ncbi:MAG: MFS transporter [Thermodesulfobacteriota bacterium]